MNNIIITKRLTIRPIELEDVYEIHKYASDKGITSLIISVFNIRFCIAIYSIIDEFV